MTDNVIPFTRASREGLEKAEQERKEASDRLRAERVHRRVNDKPMIERDSDRFHIAKNLGSILVEMERRGHRRAAFVKDIGRGNRLDSTKFLYTYTLPADADLETVGARLGKLAKKAPRYVELAKAAAVKMKENPELIVLRLFQNTTYEVLEDISDEQFAYLQQMSKLLNAMGNAAIKRNDLTSYLEALDSRRIGWDIDGSFGHFRSIPGIGCSLEDRLARHVTYLGYVPTVYLYGIWVGPTPCIEGEAFQIDFEKNSDALKQYLSGKGPLTKKHRMRVKVDIYRELWFGVAPMQSTCRWEPVFEKRYLFEIHGGDGERWVHIKTYDSSLLIELKAAKCSGLAAYGWLDYCAKLPASDGRLGLSASISPHVGRADDEFEELEREHLDGRWIIGLDRFDDKALKLDEDIDVAAGQFYYERIGLDSCMKYLREVHDPDDWRHFEGVCGAIDLNRRLWPEDEQREAWYMDYSDDGRPLVPVVAPNGTIARAIEQNLLQAAPDNRLDTVLFETVAKRVQKGLDYYRTVIGRRHRKVERLMSEWESGGDGQAS
jgi:hypothetical protein